mmetsp:Transcript_35582/g.111028  ORF Transcript_35582/g.111028 Transcript_35582/m.111028 type:complete len:213 (-) Transcript_35582:1084-1722(-)
MAELHLGLPGHVKAREEPPRVRAQGHAVRVVHPDGVRHVLHPAEHGLVHAGHDALDRPPQRLGEVEQPGVHGIAVGPARALVHGGAKPVERAIGGVAVAVALRPGIVPPLCAGVCRVVLVGAVAAAVHKTPGLHPAVDTRSCPVALAPFLPPACAARPYVVGEAPVVDFLLVVVRRPVGAPTERGSLRALLAAARLRRHRPRLLVDLGGHPC